MRKLIAFDFHGVLSKNNEKAVKFYIDLAFAEAGIPLQIDLATIVLHYGISFKQYLRMLCPGKMESFYDHLVSIITESQKRTFEPVRRYIEPQRFSRFTLEMLRSYGHDLIVVSNTPQHTIVKFTDAVNLTNCFDNIIGVDEFGGISCTQQLCSYKAHVLNTIARAGNYDEIIMIGDAASDILAGKEAGAKTYLFCSPLYDELCDMSEKWDVVIARSNPDYVIRDLRELIAEI